MTPSAHRTRAVKAAAAATLLPVARRLLLRSQSEVNAARIDDAAQTLQNVLALAPDNPDATHEVGLLAYRVEDYTEAIIWFRRASSLRPDDPSERIWLGLAMRHAGALDDAIAELQYACELAPNSVPAWYNLAEATRAAARPDEAVEALEHALQLEPRNGLVLLSLARTHASVGHVEEAATILHELLGLEPGNANAWFALSNLKTVPFDANDRAHLEQEFTQGNHETPARVRFGFAFGKALEDAGEYTRAFDVLRVANTLQRRLVHWDGASEHARVEAILRVFEADIRPPKDPSLGGEAIFIASVPRSGSSLVEQILASHPQIEGANEIDDLMRLVDAESFRRNVSFPFWIPDTQPAEWRRMGNAYIQATARWRIRSPRFTDKGLTNWMLAGTALTMLPSARVVVCRRSPLETCLACYRQLFTRGAAFTFDIDELVDYYIDFDRTTRFWAKRFPDHIFELDYETLVAEPEITIRKLLQFCGLPFDSACLEFHRTERVVLSSPSAAQVRRPLYRNSARAPRYGDKLDHLRARLRAAGLLHDYPTVTAASR